MAENVKTALAQTAGRRGGRRGKRRPKTQPIWLTREETRAFCNTFNCRCPTGLRNRVIVEVMLRAGLRVSEVCKMKRRDIKWETLQLQVRGGKGAKDRTVSVDAEVMAWLEVWDGRRPRGKTFFTTLAGGPVSARYIQQFVKRKAKKAGIEGWELITPHKLRHTYATRLSQDGADVQLIKAQLGHELIETSMRYVHAAGVEIGDWIRKRPPEQPEADRPPKSAARPQTVS